MSTMEFVVLLEHVSLLSRGCKSQMMLMKKLKHQIGQVIMNLDALIEVFDVESERIGKVLFQGKQVERLRSTQQFRTSAPEQGLGAGAKSFPRHEFSRVQMVAVAS